MSTSAGAAPPSSGLRRSARMRGGIPLPSGAPSSPVSSAPPAGAGRPSSLPRRSRRGASLAERSIRSRELDDSQPLVVILDDNEPKQHVEAEEPMKQGKEVVEAEEPEDADEDVNVSEEPPSWLPDGWIMEVRRGDNGSTYRYYTSPVSGCTFSTKMETLHYLFSEMDERVLASQACAEDSDLYRLHTWLPHGWVIEVRAGGEMMDKMYKFYVHLPTGMRFFTKEDVLSYANNGEIPRCDVKGLCDTSSEDNILAQVEFNPDGLPEGWVKEIIFRKCNGGIRKDPYYTGPVSHHIFRTLKSVMSYLETGVISKHAYIPRKTVTDIYSFDMCTDLPESMLRRLNVQGKAKQKSIGASVLDKKLLDNQTSNRSEGGTSAGLNSQSDPKQNKFKIVKATGKETISSETTKRPRGRPQKISKQIDERTSDCAKSSHKEAAHIVVKKELDIGGGERMSMENTLEYTEMKKHAMVIQEEDSERNLERSLSTRKRDKPGLVTGPDHEQENGRLTEATEKLSSSSVHKFYMRRNSNQTMSLKKV